MKKNILIIGSGVVGEATGKGFLGKGHRVTFCDVDSRVRARLASEGHDVCEDYDLNDFDVSMLCINTPTRGNKIILDYLHRALKKLGSKLADIGSYHMVVVRSTSLPGTTEEKIIPTLECYSGKKAGVDFGVCVNPEFLREASAEEDFAHPWLIVIGAYDKRSERELKYLYRSFKAEIMITDDKTAEMMKYVHNLFNATKISFFNEMYMVCQSLGIDSDVVNSMVVKSAEGIWNPEYGTKGGRPYSGSCLPKDTRAFRTFAHELKLNSMVLLDAVIKVNEQRGELADMTQKAWLKDNYIFATDTAAAVAAVPQVS
ncbi:MAG: UDP-glucose/GDP-mannose dehydrogenase family protein [Dehalococcoidia bacterium]|nr:UDP-glucose/GDP-mannose dehydrogenase family protein [Dehalococcoidia bacterium]